MLQYREFRPATVLDGSFDSVADRQAYVRLIKGEIRSRGSFISGIDVEPNFDNSGGPWLSPDDHEAENQQLAWEEVRRKRREEQQVRADVEWAEGEARILLTDPGNLRKVVDAVIDGKSITDGAFQIGAPELAVSFIGKQLYQRMLVALVPDDDDGTMMRELLSAPLAKSLRLARMIGAV